MADLFSKLITTPQIDVESGLPLENIYVTKTYLPNQKKYQELTAKIWEDRYVTNNGPLAKRLQHNLKKHLEVNHLQWVNNGTTALQMAIRSLDKTGSILTTPFTYVATANSIVWQECTPVFVDIDPHTLNIDASKIEDKITDDTIAILAVHVYGYPCDVDLIEKIALKNELKVIYDASHCFGSKLRNCSLASYGDIATISFHATKVYHTIEGGCTISKSKEVDDNIRLMVTHGHKYDQYEQVGINGKNSEFHAAIGILNLEIFNEVVTGRKAVFEKYVDTLPTDKIRFLNPENYKDFQYNYAYFPVVFESEKTVLTLINRLEKKRIFPRRYFYPSLNTLSYLNKSECPVAEDISKRVLCLPLYHDLSDKHIQMIVDEITNLFL